jgi:imidazolonepropionase-like amidohydrolase
MLPSVLAQGVSLDSSEFGVLYDQSVGLQFLEYAQGLRAMVPWRQPAIDVLRIATIEAATTVAAQDHLGTLEPGKLADIVLLDEDPLENIQNAMSVWRVMLGGRVYGSDPDLSAR